MEPPWMIEEIAHFTEEQKQDEFDGKNKQMNKTITRKIRTSKRVIVIYPMYGNRIT